MTNLWVGRVSEIVSQVSAEVVQQFAAVTGDTNPIHTDDSYAAQTRFGRRIAHGMLGASFIGAVLGSVLPGNGTIYLSQSLKFLHPIYVGDTIITRVEVVSIRSDKPLVTLRTTCVSLDGMVLIDGEAVVLAPSTS